MRPDVRLLLRAFAVALGLQTSAYALVPFVGYGYFTSPPGLLNSLVTEFHDPAVHLLELAGLCCGFGNGLIITDEWFFPWGGITPFGKPALFVTNLLIWTALSAGALIGLHRLRAARALRPPR